MPPMPRAPATPVPPTAPNKCYMNKNYREVVVPLIISLGENLKRHWGKVDDVSSKKSVADLVTKFDRETEETIKISLAKHFPEIGFYGEEGGGTLEGTFWLVDPIDGTQHFVRGLPFCSTMIALIENGEAIFSTINLFTSNEIFVAEKGKGSTCNDQPISVSQRPLKEAFVSFESNQTIAKNRKLREALRERTWLFQTLNAGFEFAMVAAGKLDARIQLDPFGEVHDFAAGALLIKEAGGIVTNLGSDKYDFQNLNSIAANPIIYQELTSGEQALFS